MKKYYLFILLILLSSAANSQFVEKVTSINYSGYNGLNPSEITVFNGKLYFFGTDDPHYVDKLMFTADGSAAGVTVVKQIDTVKQFPALRHLTVLNNLLIFDNYKQLWKSDGTAAGTSPVATMGFTESRFVAFNNKVYFAGDNTNSYPLNDQLWQTDGTSAGTTLLKTINPTGPASIYNIFTDGVKIYFGANDGINSHQLWVSDGTAAGTTLLKRLNPTGESYPSNFMAYNGKVYFSADDGVNGTQLWETDGTTAGTVEITNINPSGTMGLSPSTFTLFKSKIFFMGIDTDPFYQLWSTDGTAAGTVKVKTNYSPRNGVSGFCPTSMAVHNNMLYMSGFDSLTVTDQLWVSDGTTVGTTKVTSYAHGLYPTRLCSFQSKLIMTGYDTISNEEQIFSSDGTAAGTTCPTPPDTWGQYPFYPWQAWVPFNNALYFRGAYSYFADYQLCRYMEHPSGIEPQPSGNLTVYPNPTSGSFNVFLSGLINTTGIEVYNSMGDLVYKQKAVNNSNIIDLSNHPAGLYILKVISNNQTIGTRKIIKN